LFITGPVGTYAEVWREGHWIRLEITQVGVSPSWLPEGEAWDNLARMDLLCMDCGSEPVLMESYWVNNDLGFIVGLLVWNTDPFCWQRSMWLVEITRQHGSPGGG
jgi:hypothetical protein